MPRIVVALIVAIGSAACASAPPVPTTPIVPPGPTFEQKMSWILRLEDQRMLRDPAPPAPPPVPSPPPTRQQKAPVVVAPPPAPIPDLVPLLKDDEARIRRRAALAVGRVGLRDGVQPLVTLLADTDPEVRQMAAFALGLIASTDARDGLTMALNDPSPLVRGSAAEALGLIGDPAAADAVARMVDAVLQSGALATPPNDEAEAARDTPAAAVRLALTALVRLKASGPLSSAVLDTAGEPRVTWWPVAFALQRLEDPKSEKALLRLAQDAHPYTRAFAIKGLGALKSKAAVPQLLPLLGGNDRVVSVEAIRALGSIGDSRAAPAILKLVMTPGANPELRPEAVLALGGLPTDGAFDTLLDILGDPSPLVRAAAVNALARLDPQGFVTVLAGLDPDPDWSVRAALATVLGTLSPESGLPRLRSMLADADQRVIPAVLTSVVKLRASEAGAVLIDHLKADDPAVRKAAAEGIGELKPAGGPAALTVAFQFGGRDSTFIARAAALEALTAYGAADATPTLTMALADPDWAVRVRAATLLKRLNPSTDVADRIRPAPAHPAGFYATPHLIEPKVSPQAYIDTDRGTIQIELAVLDAPLTVENFMTLARKGFFNGLTFHRVVSDYVVQGGDPRGDSEGGPGYTIRDELNERPYLRGTVGMALDWADTGGSQFFITHSPQPHLDAKYTVFGRVVSGMDVVDQIRPGDAIRRVRVWDGETAP